MQGVNLLHLPPNAGYKLAIPATKCRVETCYTCHQMQGRNLLYLPPTGYAAIANGRTCHKQNIPTLRLYQPPSLYPADIRYTGNQPGTPTRCWNRLIPTTKCIPCRHTVYRQSTRYTYQMLEPVDTSYQVYTLQTYGIQAINQVHLPDAGTG